MWLQVAAPVLGEVKEDEARDVSRIPSSSWRAEWRKSGEVLKSPQGQRKAGRKGRKCITDPSATGVGRVSPKRLGRV